MPPKKKSGQLSKSNTLVLQSPLTTKLSTSPNTHLRICQYTVTVQNGEKRSNPDYMNKSKKMITFPKLQSRLITISAFSFRFSLRGYERERC
ncbi:hypothetical protein C1H46_045458 [Malus baccata]|uniref:Uncharacterized protein n=1 Tax=Malus baccata TaxID=106549 RepID=A0A540K452_MALBA|nr:hypothetical protein C1H46_045458 [Malus baccata]